MKRLYKWGIMAPGKMATKFTNGLKLLEKAELYAIGSRDLTRAEKFANEHGFKKYYGSYEELAGDKEIDVIYIASPHSEHFNHAMLCLKNKKAVICEKAFALNCREADSMIEEAAKPCCRTSEPKPFPPPHLRVPGCGGIRWRGKRRRRTP